MTECLLFLTQVPPTDTPLFPHYMGGSPRSPQHLAEWGGEDRVKDFSIRKV